MKKFFSNLEGGTMRKLLLLLIVLTLTIFFTSCEDVKTCEEGCDTWQSCNEDSGLCEALDGKCDNNSDCTDELVCNSETHLCEKEALECETACKAWESCNTETGICDKVAGKCETSADCTDKEKTFCDETSTCVLPTFCVFGTLDTNTNSCTPNMAAIKKIGTTGLYPNEMKLYDGFLYIVNSGDNSIQKFDPSTGETILGDNDAPFIFTGEGSNPWNFVIRNNGTLDEFFVTNLMTQSYYITDTALETTVTFADDNAFKSPEGITVTDDNIFITNINSTWDTDLGEMVFEPGFITVTNRTDNTFSKKLPTTQLNPQKVFTLNDSLYVINSGTTKYDTNYISNPNSNSGIDIFDIKDLDKTPINVEIPFSTKKQNAYVSSYTISDDKSKIYLGSGAAPELYLFDTTTNKMIRNTDNPIIIDDFGDTLSNTMLNLTLVDGYIFAINGNNDTLYVVEPLNFKVVMKINIGSDDTNVEMPQGIVFDKENRVLYIYFSLSRDIISIDVNSL